MNIRNISDKQNFGITVEPKAFKQLINAGFTQQYIDLLKRNGSHKIYLKSQHNVSLLNKYNVSEYTDCFFPIDKMDESIMDVQLKLFDKCLKKSAKKGELIPTYYSLIKDYKKYGVAIEKAAMKYEDMNNYYLGHPIITKILSLFR